MTARPYSTPAAFKQALETRLKTASATGLDFGRRRQLLVFERFLARTVLVFGDAATLKGGLALELRLERARTTRDVDLRVVGAPARILDRLQEAGRLDLGDFMAFEVQPASLSTRFPRREHRSWCVRRRYGIVLWWSPSVAQFRLLHPTDPQRSAHYGWDHALGFWVEIRAARRIVVTYDTVTSGYNRERPLEGALQALVAAGFFSHEDIGEAMVRGDVELPEEMPDDTRRVAEVVANFRDAAD